jgi:hypothetical protein
MSGVIRTSHCILRAFGLRRLYLCPALKHVPSQS